MRAAWRRLSPLPGGKALFSRFIGRMVPYSGSVRPRVLELRAGYSRITLRDRRALRNHLGSVHAVALVNVGELASGLAMTVGLPADVRGIVTSLSVEYLKKARGLLTAECETVIPDVGEQRITHQVVAAIHDEAGDEVARVTVNWLLDRRPAR
jgi:acyl-coenzyme A thioesterase PaaI-like protein